MKSLLMLLILTTSSLFALDVNSFQLVQVTDKNNESLAGAKVELIGTDKIYYTNSKGECYIPQNILKQCRSIKIECISFQSTTLMTYDINSKIILQNR